MYGRRCCCDGVVLWRCAPLVALRVKEPSPGPPQHLEITSEDVSKAGKVGWGVREESIGEGWEEDRCGGENESGMDVKRNRCR